MGLGGLIMTIYDNQILKNYLLEKRYDECVSILKNKIISFLLDKIKLYDETIEFTTVSSLVTTCDFYFHDSSIARQLEIALIQNTALEQLQNLLFICEQYDISIL